MFLQTPLVKSCALAFAVALGACDSNDDPMTPEVPEVTRFRVEIENVVQPAALIASGGFATPDGAAAPGPATPGSAYSFRVKAAPDHRLHFATMFVQSNDLFYAPGPEGIALYAEGGTPRSGDITGDVQLWDAGTEADEEPGVGASQAPRQGGPDSGAADPNPNVRLADDGFGNLPDVADAIRVELTYIGASEFMVRISALETPFTTSTGTAPVVLAPGVYAVSSTEGVLFVPGTPDRGEGLEGLAEDGTIAEFVDALDAQTGLTTPLAPGTWAVHARADVFFSNGMPDRGEGLEGLAEDGTPGDLAASALAHPATSTTGIFNTPTGAAAPGPAFPGDIYAFEIEAEPGDYLSLGTMLIQSNDLFYAPADFGLALFAGTTPRSGDITDEFLLWDAGTEVNQAPGIGADQAPRQAGPDTGATEDGLVQPVNDGYVYPQVGQVLRVRLIPLT